MGGDNVDEEVENIHQREVEEASKVSACFDQWEVQSVEAEISKPNLDLADSEQGLSKSFRVSVIIGSVLIMIAVILAITVFLPHSSKKKHARNLIGSHNWDQLSPVISLACEATHFSDVCRSSLITRGIYKADIGEIIMATMDLSSEGSQKIHLLLGRLLQGASAGNMKSKNAILNCLEFLEASIRWLAKNRATPLYNVNNIPAIRTWLSAVLTYQTDCQSALKHIPGRSKMVRKAIKHTDWVIILTSNALRMVDALDTYGPNISSWKPALNLERSRASSDKKWLWLSLLHENIPTANEIVPNLTVSKDGSSPYSTVQAAVDRAPDYCSTRFIIYIRAGVYEEIVRIPPTKFNLMLLGDGIAQTVITGSRSAQDLDGSIYSSTTVGVNAGDGFVARDISFRSGSYGAAVRVDSDLATFKNCAFRGHHYSLYAHALRHLYTDCTIEGTLLNSTAATLFHNCTIRPVAGRPTIPDTLLPSNFLSLSKASFKEP